MNAETRIVLGMPGYGKQTAAAGRGFWRACRDMRSIWNCYREGSLLAANFNNLWCLALNLVHSGERVDYFAMLHDDVGPEDFWLDALIEELEAKQLDLLGVAVPIKDARGMTSLALHREGDNWQPLARLSMHDLFELPETFTSADLPAPLLLNTGCWVCRWNQEWCRQVHFEVNDRIVFSRARNQYESQTESEDWFFSRLCHELKLKIGATRKIKVAHTGEVEFVNDRTWGTNYFDTPGVDKSPVPFAFPYDVRGWLWPQEGRALSELARGKRVLEIGSYCGLSSVCLARTASQLTCLDFWDRQIELPDFSGTLSAAFTRSLERHGVIDKVLMRHPDAALWPDQFDLAFIDGAHDVDSVLADIRKALAVLADDGLLCFHDYHSDIDPGVTQAVDELLGTGAELLSVTKTLAVVRPPASIPLEV